MRALCQAHPAAAGFVLGFVCALAIIAAILLAWIGRTARDISDDTDRE